MSWICTKSIKRDTHERRQQRHSGQKRIRTLKVVNYIRKKLDIGCLKKIFAGVFTINFEHTQQTSLVNLQTIVNLEPILH